MQFKMRQGHLGFVCLICGHASKLKDLMKRHMKSKHMTPVIYRCPSCDKKFVNRGFERHVQRSHPTWKGVDLESFRFNE